MIQFLIMPVITKLINPSFDTGRFSKARKEALLLPSLKKPGLDFSFKNFRPVSNLSYISKLSERAAAEQFTEHLTANNLHSLLQSAYKQQHSTETALLKVKKDILISMDDQHVTLHVLLDLSAALDTIHHGNLIGRLESDLGISDNALAWFKSYHRDLTDVSPTWAPCQAPVATMDMLKADEKRWLVVGICLSKVLTPAVRKIIKQEMHQLYQNMVLLPTRIHSQTSSSYLRSLPPSTVRLNYVNINNNATKSSHHSYDYCVQNELSLAKLFVKPFMSDFTGVDETLDSCALLSISRGAPNSVYHGIDIIARDVFDWIDLFSDHDGEQLLTTRVTSISAPKMDMCFGEQISNELLKLVHDEMAVLSSSVDSCSQDHKELRSKLCNLKKGFAQDLRALEGDLKSVKEDHSKTKETMFSLKRGIAERLRNREETVPQNTSISGMHYYLNIDRCAYGGVVQVASWWDNTPQRPLVNGIEFSWEALKKKMNLKFRPLDDPGVRYYLNIDRCAYGGIVLVRSLLDNTPQVRGAEVLAVNSDCSQVFYNDDVVWRPYQSASSKDIRCVPANG
ncbi:hypothetical protein AWC38_SpisGene7593 [Stylophora pistillata]|uniref:Uncharacterized protein n=1 Tax=Stylophora pistillata TaxID=50429 RepID=A0A2B4SFV8_STYPI|nr:hypothetical protein AWC38_SpisGene7593 [Stylophora pistillata]